MTASPAAIPSDAGASCGDAARVACPIDVTALSAGRPDGVYYAGRRLAPWLTFAERLELSNLEPRWTRTTAEKQARYAELRRRSAGESIVVRWEIDESLASSPTALTDKHREYESDGRGGDIVERSYIWGKQARHTDIYRLGHALLEAALSEDGLSQSHESTNDYIDEMMSTFLADPGDEWVIARRDLRRLILTKGLLEAKNDFEIAHDAAVAEGVDVSALLYGKQRKPTGGGRRRRA